MFTQTFNKPFRALITGSQSVDGKWMYSFVEQSFVPGTGEDVTADSPRTSNLTTFELNNTFIDVGVYKWIRFRGIINGDLYYEFDGV